MRGWSGARPARPPARKTQLPRLGAHGPCRVGDMTLSSWWPHARRCSRDPKLLHLCTAASHTGFTAQGQ